MDRHDRTRRRNRDHRVTPNVEGLEPREVLSFFAPFSGGLFSGATTPLNTFGSSFSQQLAARAAIVRHEYDTYVGVVKTLEFKSQATPAEFSALRDDAREIAAVASASGLAPAIAKNKAIDVSLQLDRSPLYGWAGDAAWAEVSARLTTNLQSLGIPQALIEKTLADDKAIGVSAGVDFDEFQTFTNAFSTLHAGEASLPSNPYYHFGDPGLFYSQHLRGFFRRWGMQKAAAEAQLKNDLRMIQNADGVTASGIAVVHRDVHLLEKLGAALPSSSGNAFYVSCAAFAEGVPTPGSLSQLRAGLLTTLGPAGTPERVKWVNRLVADAPAFGQTVSLSDSSVQTIVNDVQAVVDAGGGESLNPFKVSIQRTSAK
jgi:hypothetical protein